MSTAPAHLPPELRLLLSLLRAALGTAPLEPAPAATVTWPAFIALVRRHRIGAFLHHRASAAIEALCPPPVVRQLQGIADDTTRRALAQAVEQMQLVDALRAENIPALSLKGLTLAQELYGRIDGRSVGDIDLLIRPRDAAAADALLRRAGFRRVAPAFELSPYQLSQYIGLKREFEYHRTAPPLRVELPWRLDGFPPAGDPWVRPAIGEIAGRPVPTLAADLNAVYLFQHGAGHMWRRLFWLVDVALLLRAPGTDHVALIQFARQLGLDRPVLQGALLAETLLGLRRTAALRPESRERRRIARLAASAERKTVGDYVRWERNLAWLGEIGHQIGLRRRPRAKLQVMRAIVFSPDGWGQWRLPDRWFFLHYVATPFLWLVRRLRRGF